MTTDRSTVQAVVYLLGLITLACIAAATYLIDSGRSGTDVGTMLGFSGVGIGALGAILAHTGSSTSDGSGQGQVTVPVQVVPAVEPVAGPVPAVVPPGPVTVVQP